VVNAHFQGHFQVLIRRRPLLYVVGLLIPSIFLMLVDVMSFYLPINSGTRVTFKTSTLLGYTVFRVNLMDELPATAVTTPLIGKRLACCQGCFWLGTSRKSTRVPVFVFLHCLFVSEGPITYQDG
jgi:5-hydroxytryptamine receptor 3